MSQHLMVLLRKYYDIAKNQNWSKDVKIVVRRGNIITVFDVA